MQRRSMLKKWMGLAVCLFLTAVAIVSSAPAADASAVVVGRVYAIEGDLLRYVPQEKDWVTMVKDAPFGEVDTIYSGNRGMAEMIVPNGTWIRIGDNTQIQFIALDTDLSEIDVASGVARFYNKSPKSFIKATSAFGYVLAYPGTVFDFYVGENSVEAVAIKGKVTFVHTATDAQYNVAAGSPSILADSQQVSSGDGTVDPDWNRWNTTRENFWAAKARVKGRSLEYLPPGLRDEAYALEESGRWESVPYEGSSRWFWRPTNVTAGWSPFTAGRWTDWNDDQVWIPAESFGYVTHHYGNWIYAGNYWYWAPPVLNMRAGLPLLNIGFYWSPGRVSWIHRDTYVGWVPLAPRETYYSHRHWGGPHEVVVTNINISRININIGSYAYARHAVVVPRDNFYRVNNYRDVRVTNISSTTINNYRAAPVVSNTVINNYTANKQRYNFTTAAVKEKPHDTVIKRIEKNAPVIQKSKKENAVAVKEQVKNIKIGKVKREARIEAPRSTNYIVPANEVKRPKAEIKLPQREVKSKGSVVPQIQPGKDKEPERVSPARPAQPEKARPESVMPARPAPPQQAKPERVAPARPGQQEKPGEIKEPERISPARPAQPEKARPESVMPARPAPPQQAKPERIVPARPVQQEKPREIKKPERIIPARPAQPEKPAQPLDRATEKPMVKPPERDLEKSKEQMPSEKDTEKRGQGKLSEKEREKQKDRPE